MARPTNQDRWDQWRQRIERQRASGLSIAEFCRREQVSSHSFHAWKRKLRQTTSARQESGQAGGAYRPRERRTAAAPRRPLRQTLAQPGSATGRQGRQSTLRSTSAPGFLQLPVTAVRPNPWIELALADGTVVRLPQENLAALLAVLRLLRGELVAGASGENRHA